MLNEYMGFKLSNKTNQQVQNFVKSIKHYRYFHKLGENSYSHLYRLTRNGNDWKLTKYDYKHDKLQAFRTYSVNNHDIMFHLKTLGMFEFNY